MSGGATVRTWTRKSVIKALKRDAKRRGHPPGAVDWYRAAKSRPCANTVRALFGNWNEGLRAAGLEYKGVGGGFHEKPWSQDTVVEAIRAWRREQGRWPTAKDWQRTAREHPTTSTAARVCGGRWSMALQAAGLEPARTP